MLYTAENVLTPNVMRTIFKQRKELEDMRIGEKSFQVSMIKKTYLKQLYSKQ